MGYDAEKFKARANTKAGNIWLILNILLTMQYLSNMTKGTISYYRLGPIYNWCYIY